jgi:hypothetical protein
MFDSCIITRNESVSFARLKENKKADRESLKNSKAILLFCVISTVHIHSLYKSMLEIFGTNYFANASVCMITLPKSRQGTEH